MEAPVPTVIGDPGMTAVVRAQTAASAGRGGCGGEGLQGKYVELMACLCRGGKLPLPPQIL